VSVREARRDELDAVMALREAVFVAEQGIPASAARDDDDAVATHLVVTEAEEIVGACRLMPGSAGRLRLGYLVVAPFARGRGHARALLDDSAARALAGGFSVVVLQAQAEATGLYAAAGYVPLGTRTVHGIEHRTMELRVG
jgi:predicted GNAT family N-acyltransferase